MPKDTEALKSLIKTAAQVVLAGQSVAKSPPETTPPVVEEQTEQPTHPAAPSPKKSGAPGA